MQRGRQYHYYMKKKHKLRDRYKGDRMYHLYRAYHHIWFARGEGRFWKRCLSKARRRAIKSQLRGDRKFKGPEHYEQTCNWKNS